MVKHKDIKGYYRTLGVSSEASAQQIRAAFRRSAKELHPDRHPNDPEATSKFQRLNEAYSVLANVEQRAAYDRVCEDRDEPDAAPQPIDPVTCSSCGAVSAQPRYVIFTYVVSLLLATWRRSFQGVFCPSCAPKKAVLASAITWLLGWWGFPYGPIWSIASLYKNLRSGIKPDEINGQILGRQALYFWERGKFELAVAAVNQALRFNTSAQLRENLSSLKASIPSKTSPELIDRWSPLKSWGFLAQLVPCVAVIAFIVWSYRIDFLVALSEQKLAHTISARTYVRLEATPSSPVLATVRPFENFNVLVGRGELGYERIITASKMVGYVPSRFLAYGDGMEDLHRRCLPNGPVRLGNDRILLQRRAGPHELKVRNGLNSDAVLKLRDMAQHSVLTVYIQANADADIQTVPEGTFTIEFATGREFSPACGYFLSGMTVSHFVDQAHFVTRVQGNARYTSVISVTLNPVAGGTAKTVTVDGSTFERD